MGTITTWSSPAKINVFLHINGKRADGYHELQTLFAILSQGDTLDVEILNTPNIIVAPDLGFPMEDNIVYKAAKLLQNKFNVEQGAKITIHKNIPMGGGLGGGSTNAATALLVLNKLWNLNIDINTLAQLGRTLGADVPVFVNGESTFADGVGEIFTPYDIDEKWCLVVTPKNTHVSTKEIFTHPNLPRNTPKLDISNFDIHVTKNDCENLVKNLYPNIAKTLQWLLKYAHISRMTGTGASCFAIFEDQTSAEKAFGEMPDYLDGFVAQICKESPLKRELQNFKQL